GGAPADPAARPHPAGRAGGSAVRHPVQLHAERVRRRGCPGRRGAGRAAGGGPDPAAPAAHRGPPGGAAAVGQPAPPPRRAAGRRRLRARRRLPRLVAGRARGPAGGHARTDRRRRRRAAAAGRGRMTAVRPVVLTASLANFVVLADATIVVVALPSLGRDLDFSGRGLPWVVNGYSLAFGCCLLLGGYAADRLGPRLPFVLGMALFSRGSLGCAAAGTPEALVLGRLVQGVGGALFSPAALAVVSASASGPAERARALATWSAVGATAVAIGPVLGGALTGALGWRSVFWLPALVCLVAAAGGMRSLTHPVPSAAGGGLPVQRIAAACAVLGLGSAAVVGASYASTLWVQDGLHLTPAAAGLALLPLSAGVVAGAAAAPALTRRVGDRRVAVVGLAAAVAGTVLLVAATVLAAPLGLLLPASAVLAAGFGLQSVPVGALATAVDRGRG